MSFPPQPLLHLFLVSTPSFLRLLRHIHLCPWSPGRAAPSPTTSTNRCCSCRWPVAAPAAGHVSRPAAAGGLEEEERERGLGEERWHGSFSPCAPAAFHRRRPCPLAAIPQMRSYNTSSLPPPRLSPSTAYARRGTPRCAPAAPPTVHHRGGPVRLRPLLPCHRWRPFSAAARPAGREEADG